MILYGATIGLLWIYNYSDILFFKGKKTKMTSNQYTLMIMTIVISTLLLSQNVVNGLEIDDNKEMTDVDPPAEVNFKSCGGGVPYEIKRVVYDPPHCPDSNPPIEIFSLPHVIFSDEDDEEDEEDDEDEDDDDEDEEDDEDDDDEEDEDITPKFRITYEPVGHRYPYDFISQTLTQDYERRLKLNSNNIRDYASFKTGFEDQKKYCDNVKTTEELIVSVIDNGHFWELNGTFESDFRENIDKCLHSTSALIRSFEFVHNALKKGMTLVATELHERGFYGFGSHKFNIFNYPEVIGYVKENMEKDERLFEAMLKDSASVLRIRDFASRNNCDY